jgi:fructuronate reductase
VTVAPDAYDRSQLRPTVVHIGPGVFHRAHQAVYADDLLRTGARDGAIWAISLRSPGARDALAPDEFRYVVVERAGPSIDGQVGDSTRTVGSLLGIDVAALDTAAAVSRLTRPEVSVVTITVTEHGYCATEPGGPLDTARPEIVHDVAAPMSPRSLPGLLLEALVRRRDAGIAPFTVASCDNLPANGAAVRRVVGDLAECRRPALADWIRGTVSFPSSMVDRMVPATPDAAAPLVTEPFRQWVIEDAFPSGRPAWEQVGVELVGDVGAHEQAKLRILNAAHSALAYWGLLAGHRFIWQAVADPVLLRATRELLEREAIPALTAPAGWDLRRYADAVLDRFANRALPYTTAKVAGDGSQKLPVRLIPTVRAALDAGRPAPRCAQVLAAWATALAGPHRGRFDVADARLVAGDVIRPGASVGPEESVRRLIVLPGFLGPEAAAHGEFPALVARLARLMWHGDVRHVLAGLDAAVDRGSPALGPTPPSMA